MLLLGSQEQHTECYKTGVHLLQSLLGQQLHVALQQGREPGLQCCHHRMQPVDGGVGSAMPCPDLQTPKKAWLSFDVKPKL